MNLSIIEHNGSRVLTTVQLANVYETEVNNIQKNFTRNIDRFTEGKDYYKLEGKELKDFKGLLTNSQVVNKLTPSLYLWTDRGANRHSKILDTDKAWQQFDVLEETYFNVKNNAVRSLPTNFIEALECLIVSEKALLLAAPKAEYYDKLCERSHLSNFRDTAKAIGVGQKFFMEYLESHGYIYRDRHGKPRPYASAMDYFEMKDYTGRNTGTQCLITVAGKQRFFKELNVG